MRTYIGLVWAVARKDLLVEFRTYERLTAMGAFVVLIGVLFSFSIDTAVVRPQDIAGGLIWMTIIFGGMLGMGRTFSLEGVTGIEEDNIFEAGNGNGSLQELETPGSTLLFSV